MHGKKATPRGDVAGGAVLRVGYAKRWGVGGRRFSPGSVGPMSHCVGPAAGSGAAGACVCSYRTRDSVVPMSIRCDEYNGVCVLTVEGDLSGEAVAEARRAVEEASSRLNGQAFVFDLGECEFVDSSGLDLLCHVRRRCEDAGTRVTLARVGATVAKILELTRLAGRFDCHTDLTRAAAAAR